MYTKMTKFVWVLLTMVCLLEGTSQVTGKMIERKTIPMKLKKHVFNFKD